MSRRQEAREYEYGPLLSHVLGYTGSVTADDLTNPDLATEGYLNNDQIGKTGVEATFEGDLRGTYGSEQVERDANGRVTRTVSIDQQPVAGDSLELTIDTQIQKEAQQALDWATGIVNLTRGVVIVMNPQDGEILAMVSNPSYDDNLFAQGISTDRVPGARQRPEPTLINYAISEQFPPGSTYKLVTGSGALMDGIITPDTEAPDCAVSVDRPVQVLGLEHAGFGPLNVTEGFADSSDTFFYQLAGDLGADRLAYWAQQFGFGQKTGIDLPGEARGIIPTNDWKQSVFGQDVYPGEVYQAGIGQGYDAATPLQVLNAYARWPTEAGCTRPQMCVAYWLPTAASFRTSSPRFPTGWCLARTCCRRCASRHARSSTTRHTFNLVDEPLVVAGKTGTAEFGTRDAEGRLPFHTWFVAFVPNFTATTPGDPAKTDSQLAIIAFAYNSNTKGNAATEIVKYFLQEHYNLGVDLTRPDLLQQDNFYSN